VINITNIVCSKHTLDMCGVDSLPACQNFTTQPSNIGCFRQLILS